MSGFRLSEKVRAILRAHGWHDGRQVETESEIAFLRSKGFTASPIAADFLKEFNGLELQLPKGGLNWVKFDLYEELQWVDEGELRYLEALVKQPLSPVGAGGRFLMFITPAGEMIFLHDEWLQYSRTRDVHDGFEFICFLEFNDYETTMFTDDQKPP
ncbi:MAG TPA: SUKH-3 domain-containing protein [Planctomycetaceae bacterium]|jgi:hypothetical protein|nr:SUKH-3 domain-containing protein [Planctomycetaceae bacterium]